MSQSRLTPYSLLAPALVTVALALLLCLAVIIILSFSSQSNVAISNTFTLQNYLEILQRPLFPPLFLRSFQIAATVTLISVLLAYPMAYFVAFDVRRRKLVWLMVLTLPFWVSYLLRVLSWKVILGYNGVINATLQNAGITDQPLSFLLYNSTSVSIALVHAWAPFALLPIYVSLSKIDSALLSASSDLGENSVWTFLRVTLPLSMPGVAAAALLIFIPTFGDYITPSLVGGPSGAMIGTYIAQQFGASNNWPLGAAVSLVSMLLATLIACLVLAGSRRLGRIAN